MSSTMEIKAADVQKLRQATGAGLMDCKKALSDAKGDMEQAIKLLRERGIAKSSKRADHMAGEGLIVDWIFDDAKEGLLLELNSETDFVARNEEFLTLAKKLMGLLMQNSTWTSVDQIPQTDIQAFSGKVGEKIQVRRFARFKVNQGVVTSYIHAGSKLGVLLAIESNKPMNTNVSVKELAKELALQIAGANPTYVDRSEVSPQVLEREKDIVKKQMEGQNKPADILEKIAIGKLEQFYISQCLLDQPHVRDAAGKTKIKDLVSQVAKKEGVDLKVQKFVRYRVGAD